MNRRDSSLNMVTKSEVIPCTPEYRLDSPSRDSDSICDSNSTSPVPFLCTQDGAEGETDVIWNYYTPKSGTATRMRLKNSTPLSTKIKKGAKSKSDEPKRKPVRPSQKKIEIFQDLIELNQKIHEFVKSNPMQTELKEKHLSGSEDDMFSDTADISPKSILKSSSRCLRKNLLSSKCYKPDADTALESDDSMNECLLKASQIVEDEILKLSTPVKRVCYNSNMNNNNLQPNMKLDQDSMDAILTNIGFESPVMKKIKKYESPSIKNDTFDNLVENLNDSALELLTQMPVKDDNINNQPKETGEWTINEVVHESSFSKSFSRHNSMPASPSVSNLNRPSTSGMVFGRHSSMPYQNNTAEDNVTGESPIRCTPEEIKRKRQQAKEKLHAKRILPFTSHQTARELPARPNQQSSNPKNVFQHRVPSSKTNDTSNIVRNNSNDLKLLIEKKRQEALLKLRRRHQPSK